MSFVALLSLFALSTNAVTIPADCASVFKVWKSLNNNNLAPFTDGSTCCNVNGVKCNPDGTVFAIYWSSKKLTGKVSSAIGKLSNLKRL